MITIRTSTQNTYVIPGGMKADTIQSVTGEWLVNVTGDKGTDGEPVWLGAFSGVEAVWPRDTVKFVPLGGE